MGINTRAVNLIQIHNFNSETVTREGNLLPNTETTCSGEKVVKNKRLESEALGRVD